MAALDEEMRENRESHGRAPDFSENNVVGIRGSYIKDLLLPKGTSCKYCCKTFDSISSLNRHFRTSIVCDRWRARDMLKHLSLVDGGTEDLARI
jgi:hypothetical protein